MRTAASCRSTPARRAQLPGVVAVWTFADVADIPPIDFRLTRIEGLAPYRQTDPGAAAGALCRRAGRRRVRQRRLSGGGCRRSRRGRDRGAAGHSRRRRRPGEFEDGRSTEPAVVEKSYGDLCGGVPRRACGGGARARDRAAFRRADGDARRDRALRRRQRRAGDARRRQGAALEPRQHRPHARAAILRPCT